MGEQPQRDESGLEARLREVFGDSGAPYDNIPDTVVYDVFAETANQLRGEYVYLADHAETSEERERWKAKISEVRDQKREVSVEDRATQLTCIERWRAMIDELRNS